MLTQEQIARLTPEELIIAERWEAEKEQAYLIFDKMQAASNNKAREDLTSALEELASLAPSQCEHDRHIMLGCSECDALERKLYPELFAPCNVCGESVNKEELENGVCLDCDD
jgi:hypothetical protein